MTAFPKKLSSPGRKALPEHLKRVPKNVSFRKDEEELVARAADMEGLDFAVFCRVGAIEKARQVVGEPTPAVGEE